jgi:dihydroxyacetone kinase-like predicted kinase
LLPNNGNIILAAEAARDISAKQVAIVPTRSVPQGISALLSYDPDGELQDTAAAMEAAARQITTGELTRATRSVNLDGVAVKEGEYICLVDGQLSASGADLRAVLPSMLASMGVGECEIVTVYYGANVSPAEAEQFADRIAELYPDVEVELLPGGQAHYYFILGAE